jgi:hypothetical protein
MASPLNGSCYRLLRRPGMVTIQWALVENFFGFWRRPLTFVLRICRLISSEVGLSVAWQRLCHDVAQYINPCTPPLWRITSRSMTPELRRVNTFSIKEWDSSILHIQINNKTRLIHLLQLLRNYVKWHSPFHQINTHWGDKKTRKKT